MAVLNAWQKISRVLSSKPAGDGRDGAWTISSTTTQSLTNKSCSGASAQKNLGIASAGFSNGDVVLIHQSRGTGAGQWEINLVASGGGTTTLVMQEDLHYTYTDSGASQAQVFKIPMYTTVTIDNGQTLNGTDWNQDVGGFILFAASVGLVLNGAIDHKGTIAPAGSGSSDIAGATGGGFHGGASNASASSGSSQSGEGTGGAQNSSSSPNGNGGGAAQAASGAAAGGGGGGNGVAGVTSTADPGATPGQGGSVAGAADLSSMVFGGGGGGSVTSGTGAAAGGSGGGLVAIFAKDITIASTGSINVSGIDCDNTTSPYNASAGAGGSVLLLCKTATLNTNKVVALGGISSARGNNGGNGRIAIHHSGAVTGTTNPSFADVSDPSLWGGGIPNLLIF